MLVLAVSAGRLMLTCARFPGVPVSCPAPWCRIGYIIMLRQGWPVLSGGHVGQLDDGIIAQAGHGFQCHVAAALDRPFVVLFQQDGPH